MREPFSGTTLRSANKEVPPMQRRTSGCSGFMVPVAFPDEREGR
jgi:hypothetical protein